MGKQREKAGAGGEVLRNAKETAKIEKIWHVLGKARPRKPSKKYSYVEELAYLQLELIKLQEWVRMQGLRVCVVFEGRDAAGKGGVIKRITQSLNPRVCREFLRSCPVFEKMLIRSGIILIKYWFSVNDEEQERRFQERMSNPIKRWKLSPMDLQSRKRWVDYSRAKDEMFAYTDTKKSPWNVVNADDKKRARLNCITHLLRQIPYHDMKPLEFELPGRQATKYKRPKKSSQRFVEEIY